MKNFIIVIALFILSATYKTQAQGLQPGECGIRFTYDAAGDLIQREFICNTSGVVIYKAPINETSKSDTVNTINNPKVTAAEEVIKINAIMPNPTTGKFRVRLSKALNNGNVMLSDINGKVLEKRIQSGNTLTFDISLMSSGMYFVRIEAENKAFTFKVIKQ